MEVYDEYSLYYVPTENIIFAWQIGLGMEAFLGSRVNVLEVLGLPKVVESTPLH